MKLWISAITGAVLVLALSLVLFARDDEKQQDSDVQTTKKGADNIPAPKASVLESKRILDNLPQLYHRTVRFEVRNDGNGELRLSHSKQSSCTCATTSLEKESLAPGEKTNYVVVFDTKDKMGPFTISSSVITNDPKSPRLDFSVQMVICPEIMLKPTSLEFGILAEGKRTERIVVVYSAVDDDLKVSDPSASNPAVKVQTESLTADEMKPLNAKSGVRLKVIINGHLPIGPFSERVMFGTNKEKFPTCSIDASGTVEGKLQAVPKEIDFGTVSGGEAHETTVQIFGRGLNADEDLKLGEVAPAFLKAELNKDSNHKAWKLAVRLPAAAPTGSHVGSIAIMDLKGVKRMIVPIRAVVNAAVKSSSQ